MPNWTPEQHTEARVWADERGAKSRILAEALDEIERLKGVICEDLTRCPTCGRKMITVKYSRLDLSGTFGICKPCNYWQPDEQCHWDGDVSPLDSEYRERTDV